MVKGSIYQEDVMIVNIYIPNIEEPKYLKQILIDLKGEIDSNTMIVEDLITLLSYWIVHPDTKLIRKQWR